MAHPDDSDKPAVIEINNLTKKFGKFTALDNLSLIVEKGQVHGLLGPNGAGKSTTIRILLGLLTKDSGTATILGQDTWRYNVELHENLAYVPGEVTLWDNLTGGEIIDLLTHLRSRQDKDRRQKLIERFQLDPTKRFRTYSKGNRQKVALVSALSSDVDLYILDEPTSGLDPLLELVFQDEIRLLKEQGKTVLLSSHILAEVEALCDKVTIIREGRVVESGSLDTLRHLANTTIKVTTKQSPKEIEKMPGVINFVVDGEHAEFQVTHEHLNEVFEVLTKLRIEAITSHPPTLEELFMSHYEDKGS
jgi:ABC-2 type transport system ATP-binding protein